MDTCIGLTARANKVNKVNKVTKRLMPDYTQTNRPCLYMHTQGNNDYTEHSIISSSPMVSYIYKLNHE